MTGTLDLTGYKLTFDDEFNGFNSNGPSNPYTSAHTGTWDTTYSYGERHLNDEVEQYSDPTIGVDPDHAAGGVLSITAAPSADPSATWGLSYTSGVITTNHSFAQTYGYFEMRAELPEGAGMWPAFWLLPKQHIWPPELDVVEAFGAQTGSGEGGANSLHSEVLATSGGQGGWYGSSPANLYTTYNAFGVDWEASTITFYLNGQAYASMPTPAGFNQPMYMLANLAVGGHWPGYPTGETASLKIDYIRAFSGDGANPAIVQQAISSPDGGGHDFYGATDANGNGAQVMQGGPTTAGLDVDLNTASQATPVTFSQAGQITVHALSGAAEVNDFTFGDTIDLPGVTGLEGTGNQVVTQTGSLLINAFAGVTAYMSDDGHGGTEISATSATIEVYRFFDTVTGIHFYTTSADEAQSIQQTRSHLTYESAGTGLVAIQNSNDDPNAAAVYRFFDTSNGSHFYTASASERDELIASQSTLRYEDSSVFFEHLTQQTGDVAVYRFFDTSNGTHFYTDSSSERASILATRPDMKSEGIAFYEAPHTST